MGPEDSSSIAFLPESEEEETEDAQSTAAERKLETRITIVVVVVKMRTERVGRDICLWSTEGQA